MIARKHLETSCKPRKTGFNQYTASERHVSLRAFNRFFAIINEAFPDYDLIIENLIAKEDRVMVRYTINGTHKGSFMGMPPTNERITITGIDVFRLDNGKVVEHWDAAHQISAIPQPAGYRAAAQGTWHSGESAAAPHG
jgi:steroid delta-isomerase-like uncharacterized protein